MPIIRVLDAKDLSLEDYVAFVLASHMNLKRLKKQLIHIKLNINIGIFIFKKCLSRVEISFFKIHRLCLTWMHFGQGQGKMPKKKSGAGNARANLWSKEHAPKCSK